MRAKQSAGLRKEQLMITAIVEYANGNRKYNDAQSNAGYDDGLFQPLVNKRMTNVRTII